MNPRRRRWLKGLGLGLATAGLPLTAPAQAVQAGRALRFPQDHGAHLAARTEWWYATGWLGTPAAPTQGFQLTFFRSRTGLAEGNPSRFAARQLLFAHAAVTQLGATPRHPHEHLHDQRILRWNGDAQAPLAHAAPDRGEVSIRPSGLPWRLADEGTHWRAQVAASSFALDLQLRRTQPLLLQGQAGFSRKGPDERQASHYYSEVQLAAVSGAQAGTQTGQAWLDHEWSDEILHPDAVGWDWLGINLFDGSALTAFRLRRRDGSALWAGGSFRAAGGVAQAFAPDQVRFTPGRHWASPATGTAYPVEWTLDSPAGRHQLRALADAQELDSRASTGAIYWEGLSELLDGQGRRVGLGYLEMTGYAAPLALR